MAVLALGWWLGGGGCVISVLLCNWRFRTARQLAQARETLALAEGVAHFGTWRFDPTHRRVTLSREAERLCGLPHAAQGHALDHLSCLAHPADQGALAAAFTATAAQGHAPEGALRLRRPGVNMAHLIIRGQRRGSQVFGVMVDVSALKSAEARLRDAEIAAWHATLVPRDALPNRRGVAAGQDAGMLKPRGPGG